MARISTISRADRISRISQASALADRSYPVPYKSKQTFLPIKRISLDIPIYRMANIRTIVDQQLHLERNDLPADFFSQGQENDSAQAAQHGILLQLAKVSRKNIYAALETKPEQTEPLIITSAGVVLNGNRRLAAMRDLYARDPQTYAAFGHVEVAVLPADASEQELSELETDIQIAQDLKLEYGWVSKALGLRRQLEDLHWTLDRASEHWKEPKQSLTALLSRLSLAEEYLRYLGRSRQYDEVEEDELAFQRLQQRQAARVGLDPTRLETERLVMYALIANKTDIRDRLYNYAGSVDRIADRFLASPLGRSSNGAEAEKPVDQDDPLAGLPTADSQVPRSVLELLRDQSQSGDVARFAEGAYEDLRDQERRDKRGNQLSRDADRINSLAAGLSLANADVETMPLVLIQLMSSLQHVAARLVDIAAAHPDAVADLNMSGVEETVTALKEFSRRPKRK